MSKPAIKVEGVSKCYTLGSIGRHTLVDEAQHLLCKFRGKDSRAILGKVDDPTASIQSEKEFWALKNMSFEVKPGEVLGIIGGNGSGKSTLLKILSRITEPTHGSATIRGRVGSLLEVGTGFHPELTGRENVFMNGTILGMRKNEVAAKFDEIVAFSEIEKFIDTPVKRYSSGMYVRLAFAVAAHLEPEILLVDEVLAVGDAGFQAKCIGKMDDSAKEGKTILFVSHNMPAVQNLCSRSILIENGKKVIDSDTSEVIKRYFEAMATNNISNRLTQNNDGKKKEVIISDALLLNSNGHQSSSIPMGEGICVIIKVVSHKKISGIEATVAIFNDEGQRIANLSSADNSNKSFCFSTNDHKEIKCEIPRMNIMPGKYKFNLALISEKTNKAIDIVTHTLNFNVIPSDVYNTGRIPKNNPIMFLEGIWKSKKVDV